MEKDYYTYYIRVIEGAVEVQKWSHHLLGELSGTFRYRNQQDKLLSLMYGSQSRNVHTARVLGKTLFSILFDESLGKDFISFYRQVSQEKQRLRIELEIDNLPEVVDLPWELLCFSELSTSSNIWLSTALNLSFVRRQTSESNASSFQLLPGERLKLAIAVTPSSYTSGTDPKLPQLTRSQHIELLPIVNPATPEAIDAILEHKPHIFHLISNGRLAQHNQSAEIALIDDLSQELSWVQTNFLHELFTRHSPNVVLLQTEENTMRSDSHTSIRVASALAQKITSPVVSIPSSLSELSAYRFAVRVCERLAQNYPIEQAVQEGRRAIALNTQYQTQEFAAPILFMKVPNRKLLDSDQRNIQTHLSNHAEQPVERELTSNEYERLNIRKTSLESEWNTLHQKISQLRKSFTLQNDTSVKFQLEQQIPVEEARLTRIEKELEAIEQSLNTGLISSSQLLAQIDAFPQSIGSPDDPRTRPYTRNITSSAYTEAGDINIGTQNN